MNMPDGSAHFAHTETSVTGDLSKAAWDKQRVGMFTMSSTAFADIKSELEELCNQTQNCQWDQVNAALNQHLFNTLYDMGPK